MIYMPFPLKFRGLKKTRDGRTDGRTDRPSYRDAWTHLKRIFYLASFQRDVGYRETYLLDKSDPRRSETSRNSSHDSPLRTPKGT